MMLNPIADSTAANPVTVGDNAVAPVSSSDQGASSGDFPGMVDEYSTAMQSGDEGPQLVAPVLQPEEPDAQETAELAAELAIGFQVPLITQLLQDGSLGETALLAAQFFQVTLSPVQEDASEVQENGQEMLPELVSSAIPSGDMEIDSKNLSPVVFTETMLDLSSDSMAPSTVVELTPTVAPSDQTEVPLQDPSKLVQDQGPLNNPGMQRAENSSYVAKGNEKRVLRQSGSTAKALPATSDVKGPDESASLLLSESIKHLESVTRPMQGAGTAPLATTSLRANSVTESSQSLSKITMGAMESLVKSRSVQEQVEQALRSVVKEKGQNVEIRLDPPEWGKVFVRLEMQRDNQVEVSFLAEHHFVRDALDRGLAQLRQSFSEQGLQLGSVQIGVGLESGGKHQGEEEQYSSPRDADEVAPKGLAAALGRRAQVSAIDTVV